MDVPLTKSSCFSNEPNQNSSLYSCTYNSWRIWLLSAESDSLSWKIFSNLVFGRIMTKIVQSGMLSAGEARDFWNPSQEKYCCWNAGVDQSKTKVTKTSDPI